MASVWLHQGGWKKVLGRDPSHQRIVAAVPGLSPSPARVGTKGLGLLETTLAAWVLSGRRSREAAMVQTALVVGINAGGLIVARDAIPWPGRLLVRNLAFLACVWRAA